MDFINKYFSLNKTFLFLAVVTAYAGILFLSNSLLINDTVFYNAYSEQLSYQRAMDLFHWLNRISWIGYIIIPFTLLLKIFIVSVVLYIGILMADLSVRLSFKSVWGIVLASEGIFVLAALLKFLWFFLFAGNYDMNDISFFYPLSLGNLFDPSDINKMWLAPLQIFNIFQLLYIILLSVGLSGIDGLSKSLAERSVLISYLPGLFIWVAFLMFLSLGK